MQIQAINIVESPRFRKLLLLLRQELKESDIPGRTTIRNRISDAFQVNLKELQETLQVSCFILSGQVSYMLQQNSLGKISFTTDGWSDPVQRPFLAITAHWIQEISGTTLTGNQKLSLASALIGFHHLPGRHTGEHLAHCFMFITDRLGITEKVSSHIHISNVPNNIPICVDGMGQC